jgi:SAM-dependent methyltransferase
VTTAPSTTGVDVDALMNEVRARIKLRRETGRYDAGVQAALDRPLPGGAPLFTDDLADPLKALPDVLDADLSYDPRSRKRYVGPVITLARRTVIWLLRFWIGDIVERQDRVNRLLYAAIRQQALAPSPLGEARLAAIEAALARRDRDEIAANLEWKYLAARFSGVEEQIRAQAEPFVALFPRGGRVLDLGSGRGFVLGLLKESGLDAYGVDIDGAAVAESRARGLEVYEDDAEAHLRTVADHSLDGIYSAHVAEHVFPGKLVEILRQARRVLKPGAPLVMATPNAATLTVSAHTFYLDPSHRRPIPPELFQFYLEVEGFSGVEVRSYARSEERLNEKDVPEGAIRDNVRLLNRVLFGDRDYAVIGRAPTTPNT